VVRRCCSCTARAGCRNFDALAEHYELLVPEHPGFGGSDDPPWIHSMSDLAMFYLDLVEKVGLDRIHLMAGTNERPIFVA
jgi:pimeloyl-ACP methyl ester carboxylesterase